LNHVELLINRISSYCWTKYRNFRQIATLSHCFCNF